MSEGTGSATASGAEPPDRVNVPIVTVGGLLLPFFVAIGPIVPGPPREPTAVKIEFEGPSGCSSVDAFYEGVHSRTDRVRWALDGESAVQIRIRLFRAGAKIKGELRLSDQEGEKETRKVDGATCDEVVEALSLTVTLALDPSALLVAKKSTEPSTSDAGKGDGAARTDAGAAPASPAASTTGPPSKALPPSRRPAALSSSSMRTEFGVQMLAASVTSPGASFGGALSGRFILASSTLGQWSTGVTLLHVQNDFLGSANWGALALTAAVLDVCPLRQASTLLDVELCAAAMGGWLRGGGSRIVTHPDTVSRSWWSLGLRGDASLALTGSLRLEPNIGVQVPIVRRQFVVSTPEQDVGHTSQIAVLGGLGLALRF